MPAFVYKLYIDGKAATQEQLDRFEDITVEQEIDKAWEAQLNLPVCLTEKGKWRNEDIDFLKSFTRIRVEIKAEKKEWVPLIDGPIAGLDNSMSAEPGQSTVTLMVHDDSVYLNKQDVEEEFDNKPDHEIAKTLLTSVDQINEANVDTVSAPQNGNRTRSVFYGQTAIRVLRELARRNNMHAYVLPGTEAGKSVGYFKELPSEPVEELPALTAVGEERNLSNINIRYNPQSETEYTASRISLSDKGVVTQTSNASDRQLLGSQTPEQSGENANRRILSMHFNEGMDLQQAVQSASNRTRYAFQGSGSVVTSCYEGILRPFQVVMIKGVNSKYSGYYVISKVTHKMTRSYYSQEFEVKRDAVSEGDNSGGDGFLSSAVNAAGSVL